MHGIGVLAGPRMVLMCNNTQVGNTCTLCGFWDPCDHCVVMHFGTKHSMEFQMVMGKSFEEWLENDYANGNG